MNEVLDTPAAAAWPGLHLTKLADNDQAKPVLRLVADLDAERRRRRLAVRQAPWCRRRGSGDGQLSDRRRVGPRPTARARAEPSIDTLKFLAVAAAEAIHLIENATTNRQIYANSPEWRHGYRTALADLRGSEELRILKERTAELRRLVYPRVPVNGSIP